MTQARDGGGYRRIVLVATAVMGAGWLGVVPLVSANISRLVGLAKLSLLFGLAFVYHRIGGSAGYSIGGIVLDPTGGYDVGWWALVGIGAAAALQQGPMSGQPHVDSGPARESAA
ncbi:hypothetical protein WDZ92_46665 [Nostoc sp. NIES-2111]